MNIGDRVTLTPDCSLWAGRPGVVEMFREMEDKTLPYPEGTTVGVRVEREPGRFASSWFAPKELIVATDTSFLIAVGLIESINDLIHAEKGCDHMDDSTLRWVEFIGDDGIGEDHQVCKACNKVACCPGIDGKYPRAVR